jgi:phosphoribosylamine-glycine ligase
MATGHRLPNGYVVLLLTPREATLHRDQILAPEDYPWGSSESQMVAMEIRNILTKAVTEDSLHRLGTAANEMMNVMATQAEVEKAKKKGYWQCRDCEYVNDRDRAECERCGLDRPEPEEPVSVELP